ncbi:MAG: UDP-N-acetylmuramoyl-L-alanine--D-glutamate ligase [Patescibacteria group bacterium]
MMSNDRKYYSKARQENKTASSLPAHLAGKPQRVLVFGLGLNGGGVGSARFFSRQGAKVTVTDLKSKKALSASLAKLSSFPDIKYVLGKHRLADFLASDLIVKNPAIPWNNHFLKKAQSQGIPVVTDTIIFFNQAPALIVGITGTKGKSTTATLLAKLLKKKYPRVWLAGNIGESFLDKLPKVKPQDVVVAELSSFQLEDLALIKKSPQIAIITNIFPDHLNRYASFREYAQAKTNIFLHQKPTDYLIINDNDKFLVKLTKKTKAKKHLLKTTNLSPLEINIALATEAARILEAPQKEIARVLKNFRGLAGRQEIIRKFQNRIFINDTTATNPTAVLVALQFVTRKYRQPIILIAGGQDKNLNYEKMAQEINKKVKRLVLLPGSATEKLKKHLKKEFSEAENMEEAVKKAYDLSQTGDLVLLSPGAASFNLFENEFDRGAQFNQYVKKLRK